LEFRRVLFRSGSAFHSRGNWFCLVIGFWDPAHQKASALFFRRQESIPLSLIFLKERLVKPILTFSNRKCCLSPFLPGARKESRRNILKRLSAFASMPRPEGLNM